jgi:hypothetical protein
MLPLNCFIAQAPPTSTDLIQMFRDSHAQLTTTFNLFVGAITAILAFAGILFAITGFRNRQEIQQTLKEARLKIAEQVRSEVDRQISEKINEEVGYIKRMAGREAVIGRTQVGYVYITDDMDFTLPEYVLLEARGFQVNHWHYQRDRRWPSSHVFVIDLITPNPSDERKEALVAEITREFLNQSHPPAVLVFYVKGRVEAINTLPRELNYITSNMRGTLLGAVVDAAQIAHALRYQPPR